MVGMTKRRLRIRFKHALDPATGKLLAEMCEHCQREGHGAIATPALSQVERLADDAPIARRNELTVLDSTLHSVPAFRREFLRRMVPRNWLTLEAPRARLNRAPGARRLRDWRVTCGNCGKC